MYVAQAFLAPQCAARYPRARLLARIYEVFPLLCPLCAAQKQIVAFVTEPATVRTILAHVGEPIRPPVIAPLRLEAHRSGTCPTPSRTASTPRQHTPAKLPCHLSFNKSMTSETPVSLLWRLDGVSADEHNLTDGISIYSIAVVQPHVHRPPPRWLIEVSFSSYEAILTLQLNQITRLMII